MRVFLSGDKKITGARDLDCPMCNASLQITRTDVQFKPTTLDRNYNYKYIYIVSCQECGNEIQVKNEMENL
jgi:predicted nucleic acid-binding Zn ribbon protein